MFVDIIPNATAQLPAFTIPKSGAEATMGNGSSCAGDAGPAAKGRVPVGDMAFLPGAYGSRVAHPLRSLTWRRPFPGASFCCFGCTPVADKASRLRISGAVGAA